MRQRAEKIIAALKQEYREAKIALEFGSPWELLVAVILSAQCTDVRVNIVTKKLFKKYKTLDDYARAKAAEFEQDIRSTGFFRNKAKNIIASAGKVRDEFGGRVPDTMEALLSLPGVARKTANIVLFNVYGKKEGIAVDTHVRRLSQRLGFTRNDDPGKIEKDLMALIPQADWGKISYVLIEHGRAVCQARKPRCAQCCVKMLCPSAGK